MGTFSTGSKVSDLHIHVHIRNINIIYIDHIDMLVWDIVTSSVWLNSFPKYNITVIYPSCFPGYFNIIFISYISESRQITLGSMP